YHSGSQLPILIRVSCDKKKGFKLEAKAGKGSASSSPFFFRFLAWASLALIIGASVWFWSPQWGTSRVVSEPEKKLRELSRENPDAEVFEVKPDKTK
ncbi:MAG: hypothetical protein V4507_03765, partial [Verrucomicrobiota bacterium]